MNTGMKLAKRIMALVLALTLTLTTLGEYAPAWFNAFAEETEAQGESVAQPDSASNAKAENTPIREEADTPSAKDEAVQAAESAGEAKADKPVNAAETSAEERADPPAATVETSAEEKADQPVATVETSAEEKADQPVATVETSAEEKADQPVATVGASVEEKADQPMASVENDGEEEIEETKDAAVTNGAEDANKTEVAADVNVTEDADVTEDTSDANGAEDAEGNENVAEKSDEGASEKTEESTEAFAPEEGATEHSVVKGEQPAEAGLPTGVSSMEPVDAPDAAKDAETNPLSSSPAHTEMVVVPNRANLSDAPANEEAPAEQEAAEETVIETSADVEETVQSALVMAPLDLVSAAASDKEAPKEGISVLQQKILDAMSGTLSGKVQVILERNTIYEANKTPTDAKWNDKVLISSEDYDTKDDFELELVAEDAIENENEGEGYTTINANLVIQGVKVVMKSVMMAADKTITVSKGKYDNSNGGELVYHGTKNAVNTLTVNVEDKSSAEIYADGSDDVINATTKSGAASLLIDAGEGLDRVNVVAGGGEVEIKTGGGNDTVNVNISGDNQGVRVDTGASTDYVTIIDNGKAADGKAMTVNTGDGDDQITLDVRANGGDLTLDTGTGAASVTVMKGDNRTVENLDYAANNNPTETIKSANGAGAKISFVNGDAANVDRFTVDANAGLAVDELHFEGGAGASVYFRGSLNKNLPEGVTNPIGYIDASQPAKGFALRVASGQDDPDTARDKDYRLKITYADLEHMNFTDALKNKKRAEDVHATGTGTYTVTANDDFTDYVVKTVDDGIGKLAVNSARPLLLSNLVIDADELGDDAPYIPGIDAKNLNVLIKAPTINIDRAIRAQNVRAESAMGSLSLGGAFEEHDAGKSLLDIAADMLTVADTAEINVNAAITTARDIALVARVKHFGGMVSVLPESLNLINVKVATAKVNLKSGANLNAGGFATADAKIQTTLGYTTKEDETTGALIQTQEGGPVGIDVVVNNAAVTVDQGANIEAGNDAIFTSKSDIRDYNYALYGAFKSPLALAVSAIANTVNVRVDGAVTADRKVKLSASGTVADETEAFYQTGKNAALNGAFGGFVAVSVIDQDVSAVIGEHAKVVARRGSVAVYSNATADVKTIATAGGDKAAKEASPAVDSAVALFKSLGGLVFEKLKGKFLDTESEKFIKTVTKVSASTYSVKVVDPTDENDAGGSATVKTKVGEALDEDEGTYATYGLVEPTPNAGYSVQSVMIRFLEEGKDQYTYKEVPKNRKGEYLFLLEHEDVEVLVTYAKDGEHAKAIQGAEQLDAAEADDLEDVYDLSGLFNDAAEGVAGSADDDDDFVIEGGAENATTHKLHTLEIDNGDDSAFITGGGKIVTWKTTEAGGNLTQIFGGQKVRFVPNPDEGNELKTLTVVYTHTVDDAEVTEEITVTADEQGRYIFTVPDDLDKAGTAFQVKAAFGEKTPGAKQPAHKQATGSLAVGVTLNEGVSRIEPGSVVSAGGAVDMYGFKRTNTNTYADGTAIVEKSEEDVAAEAGKPQNIQKIRYSVSGANVALKAGGTLAGEITSNVSLSDGHSSVTPKITFKVSDDEAKSRISTAQVVISYYTKLNTSLSKGKRVSETVDAKVDGDGNYYVDLNSSAYAAVDGSTLEVNFVFKDAQGSVLTPESGAQAASKYLVPNPIRTSVNQIKEQDQTAQSAKSLGEVNFVRMDENDGKPIYYFRINANVDGYKCDPADGATTVGDADSQVTTSNKSALYATWIGADGSAQKAALSQDATESTMWYLKSVNGNVVIPEGAVITVVAVFSEDKRDVKLNYEPDDPDGSKRGTAKASKTAAKQDDKITVTLTAQKGWVPVGVNALLKSGTTASSRRIDDANIVDKGNGVWEITVPKYKDGEKLYITPLFNQKTIALQNTGDVDVQTSESDGKAANGQTITIKPTDDDIRAGKKLDLANTTVTYQGKKLTVSADGAFTIPKGDAYTATELTIKAALKEKDHAITAYTSAEGDKIEPASGKADAGETVTLNIVPRDGYRAKGGTVKAVVTTKDAKGNVSTKQIVADWVGENTYQFKLTAEGTIQSVKIEGEFEEGSDGVEFAMGVAVAVGVTQGKNTVEIAGGDITTNGGLSMMGVSIGNKAITAAKAGFNSGDTGIAGAFAVQVAKTVTDVAVREGARLTLKDNGSINMTAKGRQEFKVTGDASGKQDGNEAEGTGVGAGIAVAVDGMESNAVIEDGVALNAGSHITGITLNADHKYKDQVTAKAGASGGTAVVPVAAVDVFSSNVRASMGKLAGAGLENGTLGVDGRVNLKAAGDSARAQYNHEVTADASARGDGAAIGAAIIVTWLENDVKALLRQSVNATRDVSLTSLAGDALKAVAKASTVGGGDGEEGSADEQADKILKGAGGMAGKYGDMNGGDIMNGANGRQKAETAEQSVAGAGALVLNMHQNKSRAEVEDAVDVATDGKLTVKSSNRTDATIKADASATHSDIGVGVGVAINIVTMDNIARIGSGTITASELEVVAEIAKAPTKVRTVTVVEDVSAFNETLTRQLQEAIKELMGEELYDKLDWAGDSISAFLATAADTLINELNLTDLFNKMGSDAGSMFADAGTLIWERLKSFPQALVSPLLEVYEEAYGSIEGLTEGTLTTILETAWNEVSVQLLGNAADAMKGLVNNSLAKVGGSVIDAITGKVTGKGGGGEKIKEALKDAVVDMLKDVLDKTIEQTVRNIGAQFPLLNESNVAFIKNLKSKGLSTLKESFIPYVTSTFREKVWDYAPLVEKIEQAGFVQALKDTLRTVLKESTIAMTNQAIDSLLGKMDVKFEREAIEDRHIITTQAIAGSGAKKKSGAGSVAIAVANLTTIAEIAGGAGAVTVEGDTILNAEEVRRVRTHSTAAVDKRGEADNNEGVEDSDDANTGGGDAATNTVTSPDGKYPAVTVTTGVGGKVEFSNNEDGRIYIIPDAGYTLDLDHLSEVVVRTYNEIKEDDDGDEPAEVVDTPTVEKYGDSFLIIPAYGTGADRLDEDELEQFRINLDIQFTEVLRELPKVQQSSNSGAEAYKGEITLGVEGREDDPAGGVWARANDLGEITIPTQSGLKVKSVVVSTKDNKLLTFGSDEEDEIALASANSAEEVYVFKVPDGTVDMIHVVFENDDDEERAANLRKAEKDRAGRTVGVGAAFTLTYGNSEVAAEIGSRAAGVTAGTLAVTASSEHEEENFATAGSDPFEGTSDDIKDFSLDAAVSVNILDNDVRAKIADGGKVRTTAAPEDSDGEADTDDPDEDEPGEDEPEEIEVTSGALIVSATEVGENEAKASAFAAGSATAVGASVAVNVSLSDIAAELGSDAEVSGKAVVRSHSLSKDNTWAFASAMGADIQRNLNKFADKVKATEENANKLTTGEFFDKKEEKKTTDTNVKINSRLNKDGVKQEGGGKARNDLNVSTNVMRSQKVQVDSGEDAADGANEAGGFVNTEGNQALGGYTNPNKKSTLQVAAAVGVTVAQHSAKATVNKAIDAGGDIAVTATDAGNFNTRSTGLAMTLAKGKGKTIAAAVGVSVNKNEAIATVGGDLNADDGDVTVSSSLKQNMTDIYRGKLAVQSIAGSVSGKGSDASIAGAISVVVSDARSEAEVGGDLSGNAVSVTAYDKSKLAVRAGGINFSKGANVGMGISVATIWSGNKVRAEVKDGATIDADSFALKAVKAPVTWDDYKFPLSMQDLISDSSDLDDEERENVYPGLIDVHRKPGEKSYTVDININTYNLMKAADALNFLSSKNYYTEAIAGSLSTGQASSSSPNALNAAGSISIVRAVNTVDAILGNNVTINKGGRKAEGSVDVLAQDDVTARMLGGAISAGNAKTGVGVTVTFLYDEDAVTAKTGDNLNINAGSVSQKAVASTNVEGYNAAASVTTTSQGSASIGGGIDVILLKNTADAVLGKNTHIDAGGKLDIAADSDVNLLLIAVSASVAKKAVAAGGTIAFAKNDSKANVNVGANHSLSAEDDVTIAAKAVEDVISIIASASAAVTGKSAVAGSVNVLVDNAVGKVSMAAGGAGIASRSGSVFLTGETETRAVNATLAAAGAKDKAIGLSANVSVLQRESGVDVKGGVNYKIDAAKEVLISGYGNDYSLAVSLAVAAGVSGLGLSGNLPVLVSRNKVKTTLGSVTVNAGGEAAFAARLDDTTKAVAGSIGASWSNNAAAATAMFVNKANTVITDMGTSRVTAAGSAGTLAKQLPGEAGTFKGVYVGAKVVDDVLAIAAGIALSGKNGITGNVLWSGNDNTVKADASGATLSALQKNAKNQNVGGGSVAVEAKNDSKQIILAGGLNAAKTIAAGATLVVLTSAKEVTALAHNAKAWQDVNVTASNTDDVFELAVSAGGSGKAAVEIGIAYQSLKSKVNAVVASEVEAVNGSFNLKSVNNANLDNVAVALAGAGKLAATPVFAMTAFTGESNAILGGGTVKAGKAVNVSAEADRDMGQYTVGASASGGAALSGAVSVTSLKDAANALVKSGTSITANTLNVTSRGDYSQLGASAAIAGAGKAGVAVNGMLTIAKSSALAEMDGAASLSDKAVVKATSDRDIVNVAATLAVGGQAGVGVTVMGLVAGDRMDQDAADMLTYGNASNKDSKTFDSSAIVDKMKALGVKDTSDLDGSLSDDLSGNGNRNADMNVGKEFDGSSGYVDDGVYDGNQTGGENKQMTETDDVKKAKNLGNTAYSADPKDSVVARIGANGNVAAKGVDVTAEQDTKADVFGATVSGGGSAGVGASLAIAMLRSNVFASATGAIDAKAGAVNVTATSKSGSVIAEQGSDEAKRNEAIANDLGSSDDDDLNEIIDDLKATLNKRSIRVYGLAAGVAGEVGLGVAGSVVRTDNITRATVSGSVKNADALNVNATSDYGNVSAFTMAIGGGGEVGVSAAFAVALANGTVESKLDKSANITGANTKIAVATDSVVNARALSVTAAGGGYAGVAAGVAVASNQLTQNTLVENGAKINMTGSSGALTVKGRSSTLANSYLAGVSVGLAGVGLGAAASIVKPTLNTSIGDVGTGNVSLGKLQSVDVLNDVTSSAAANVLSVAAGGAAAQGNVLLVFNETDATAKVANASGMLGRLKINGDLGAAGKSRFASAAIGGFAAGISVAYVDVDSENKAILDTDNFTATVTGDLTVSTGENKNYKTLADAKSLAAAVGGASVSLNAAVARNRAKNTASITGKNGLTATTVNLNARVNGDASAKFYGLSVGAASVAGSVNVALNEATSNATMKLGGTLDASLNAASDATGDTAAKMYTGSGAIYGVKVNVAVAYGRTNSIIDVDVAKAPASAKKISVNAKNTGKDDVSATIDNQSFEMYSAAAMVGLAYSQDVYSAKVKLGGGNYNASKVSVTTDYDTTATATVTPSAAGVDLSLAKIAVNYAGAKSTAHAGAELELADGANLNVDGDVAVKTTGKAETSSRVKSAEFLTLNVIGIGVNISDSDVSATQAATLRMNGGKIGKANAVKVESLTDKAKAAAAVGTSGVDEKHKSSVSVSLVNVNVNSANAKENLASTAAILGSGRGANSLAANSLTLRVGANDDTSAKAKSTSGTEIGLISGGGLLADATSSDSFNAVLSGVAANIAGEANLTSATRTLASAEGAAPGNWALLEVSVSEMEASVGSGGDMQTSKVLIGDDTTLITGGALNIAASNSGNAYTDLAQADANSLLGIKVSKMPTQSWYDTGVSIGKNAVLTSKAAANIASTSNAKANSSVDSSGVGLAFDVSHMKGSNTLHDDNNLDIGERAAITADRDLNLSVGSSAQLTASSKFGGGGALAGEYALAENSVTRAARVTIGKRAELTSNDGDLNITSATGEKDKILTKSRVEAGGAFLLGRAYATTNMTSNSEILVGESVLLTASDDLNLLARATSRNSENTYGTDTDAVVKSRGLGINPDAYATAKLNFNAYIDINRGSEGEPSTGQLMSNRSDTNIVADNEGMWVHAHTNADGKAVGGWSKAESVVEANLGNTIWIDNNNLYAKKTAHLLAGNAGDGKKPVFDIEALAEMYAVGDSKPLAKLNGLPFNQIRTNDARIIRRKTSKFTHVANAPREDVIANLSAKEANMSSGGSTKKNTDKQVFDWKGAKRRCDFCPEKKKGEGVERVNASDRALRDSFAKALFPLTDIQRMLKELGISKARYGEEDYMAAGKIFALEHPVPLKKDVTLNNAQILRYRLWTNAPAQLDVLLLPNATRLYGRNRNGAINLQYVAEVISGDVRGNGEIHEIDIITTLTTYAARHPVIPVGATGSLDVSTGTLSLPARADFELYLHEISAAWLIDNLGSDFIRMLTGDQDAINDAATRGAELPNGQLVAGLADGGVEDGWRLYWLPESPSTATSPSQTLICLMVNEETDEVDAFRTNLKMIEAGEAPVDVSLYLYRDAKSDGMGVEKYNALFFDTPAGEKSLVKVVTDVLSNREIQMPKGLNIALRGFGIEGADFPVYSLTDHFFAICNGTDGEVSMFDGFYENTFDGDTFESDYIRIEGIADGDLNVTLKEGQSIWPEQTGEDIAGSGYVRVDAV